MTEAAKALDVAARRLISAAEEDLRRSLPQRQIDRDLLGTLYLRVREALERQPSCDETAVDDIALTMYLTLSAWQQPDGAPPLHLLSSLHQVIGAVLASESFQPAPENGARRKP